MFATHAAVFWDMFSLACFSIFGSLLCGPIQSLGYLIPLAVSPRPQNACELASWSDLLSFLPTVSFESFESFESCESFESFESCESFESFESFVKSHPSKVI